MGARERRKGKDFENEIARDLREAWGRSVRRNIGQARDGGDDITVPPFRIECKRRRGIAVREWLVQVERCSNPEDIPVVIAKPDWFEPVVVLRYKDFKQLALSRLEPETPETSE